MKLTARSSGDMAATAAASVLRRRCVAVEFDIAAEGKAANRHAFIAMSSRKVQSKPSEKIGFTRTSGRSKNVQLVKETTKAQTKRKHSILRAPNMCEIDTNS